MAGPHSIGRLSVNLSRRQFAILSAAIAAGCDRAKESDRPRKSRATTSTQVAVSTQPGEPETNPTTTTTAGMVDAGPVSDYASDEVYDAYRQQGFFVIRRNKQLFALSSICTHKGCKVRVQEDQTYLCKCHNSRFDAAGKVTKGPATRDLPRLAVALDANTHVLVKTGQPPRST